MSSEVESVLINKNEDELRILLEQYITKSEELEKRESKVIEHLELIQSVIASLKVWRSKRKTFQVSSESAPGSLKDIEEETKKIREETMKIQQEIDKKMLERKSLEEKVKRRRALENERIVKIEGEEETPNNLAAQKEEIELRNSKEGSDAAHESFKDKVMKLNEMEKNLKKEFRRLSETIRRRTKSQNDRVSLLEYESLIHKEFVEGLKSKKKLNVNV